jgi:hypothetical protein
MKPLFPIPASLAPPSSDAQKLFAAQKFDATIAYCDKELAALEKKIPARSTKPPQQAEAGSAPFQYYALTVILVNALAATEHWKTAKEALGKYRVHFPQDPWGFEAGAEVTRRDTAIKDKAAVQRAIELLEGEAARLREQTTKN